MSVYRVQRTSATYDEAYVNGLCTLCGLPRRQCAEEMGDPFIEVEEEGK